nr:hypothetical protein [Tanacetum cinerariifolium]
MSRDVITVGSTMRIPLLYRGEYSQWRERFMNYLEEHIDGEAMINSSQNDDQPLHVIAQVSLAGNAHNAPPTLKDLKFWTAEEKKTQKIDRLARSLLIQGLPNEIYSLIDSNETAKDLWNALERKMRGFEYGEQDRKAAILYEYETFKAIEGEQLLDTYLRYLHVINDLKKCGYKKDNYELNYKFLNNLQPEWKQYGTLMRKTNNLMDINNDALYNILKQNQGDVNDALGYKKKAVVVTSDPLALVAEKINVSKRKEKVVVSSDSEGSGVDDFSELKKITALLAKDFNRRKFYSKPTNNNLRISSTSQSANKKQEFVKLDDKKEDKKDDEKKRDMSKIKCYNCKKKEHFAKDCKKAKVKDYNYYKTNMLLSKKDSNEQVLLAEDQTWMESSIDSDQEINANMVFMAQIKKVLSESDESSSSAEETIAEVAYYTSKSESKSEYETSEYYNNFNNYGLFVNNDDDQENFHDAIEYASENFIESHIDSQKDYDKSEVDHNDAKEKEHLVDKFIRKFNHKIAKCQKRVEKANQQSKDFKNQNKDLQEKYDVLINQKKESSNTSNVDLSVVSLLKLNKNVKRYSRKDLLSCNNSHLGEKSSAYVCNDAMNVSCNSRMCDLLVDNNFFIFDDESVKISPVSKMPFRKKPCDSMNVRSKSSSNKSLPRTVHKWLPKLQPLAEPIAKWFPRIVQIYLWIINSGCSKNMTGNRALLTNFMEKFLGTVRFGNNDFAVIAGYGDMIHESINVNFDEISEMASKQFSLETGLSNLNETRKSSNPSVSQVSETLKKDLEDLFHNSYDEYFDSSKIMKSLTMNVETSINEKVFHEVSESFQGESSSSSLNDDVQQSSQEVILPQTNTQSISNNMIPNGDEANTSHNVFNKRLEDAYFDASTSFHDPSNVHTYYQPYPYEKK